MSFLVVSLLVHAVGAAVLVQDKLDHYLIGCHTTDFVCFKRQYIALRDHVLLGNSFLRIPTHKPYTFLYGDSGTCIQLSGLERSELLGLSFDSNHKEYSMVVHLPLRIHQVKNSTNVCAKPDRDFTTPLNQTTGQFMKFTGNATIQVTFPYNLTKKNEEIHLDLQDEDVDVILDIPDLSYFDKNSEVEMRLYQWSEWAYEVVQHVDAAQKFAIPYTTQMHVLMEQVPLKKFILLYPEEKYSELQFIFTETLLSP